MAEVTKLAQRFSWAAARYMSVSKSAPARSIYEMQTDGCKQYLDDMGRELRDALRSAGIRFRAIERKAKRNSGRRAR